MQGSMNEVSISRQVKRACLLSFLSIAFAAMLAAQTETATLCGTVRDTTGKALPRIVLVIFEMATNMTVRIVETDSAGKFNAAYLKPGAYKMSILQKGYQTFLQDGIQLDPAEVRELDPVLPAGEPEDTTATRAKVELLDHSTGAIRDNVNGEERYPEAPEVDRFPSPFPLLATTPGVQGNGVNLMPSLVMGGISDRNLRSFQMDSIPDDLTPGFYEHPYFFEFLQTTTANPGLDASRPSSFDLVTKRGSEGFHGSAFGRRGDSRADARPFFYPQRDNYRILEGGGDAGGVVLKERLYFYGGWVYMSNPDSENVYADVPTAQERVRDFSQFLNAATTPNGQEVVIRDPRNNAPFPDNQIPSNRVLAIPTNILNDGYYPAPNVGGSNLFFQNYTFVHPFGPYLYRGNWPIGRLDMRLADENHVTFRWMRSLSSSVNPGTTGEDLDTTQETKYSGLLATDTETVTPYLLNHILFGYNTNTTLRGQGVGKETPLTGDEAVNSLGIQGTNADDHSVQGFPQITVSGLTPLTMPAGGGATNNVAENDSILTLRDDVAWSRAGHAFKLGGDFTRINSLLGEVPLLNYGAFNFNGMFTGLGFADFLLGLPATSSRILQPRVDDKVKQTLGGAYITDSWRVTQRLHLDYGVRWDYVGSPHYADGYAWNWNPANDTVVVATGTLTEVNEYYPANVKVVEGTTVPKAKTTNLRPRIAAAYRLSDNLVVRGGYAEFTNGTGLGANGRLNDPNGPYQLTETYYNSDTNGVIPYSWPSPWPTTLSSTLVGPQNVNALPAKTDEGVIRQYNATVERVMAGTVLRASLIGARGVGMNYTVNMNAAQPSKTSITQARLPYPQFGAADETYTNGSWHYDSAQAQAHRRMGSVTFDSSVTFANNISDYANTYDPFHVTEHWTRDASDRRLYFVGSAVWALPVGKGKALLTNAGPTANKLLADWTLQTIVTVASGQYYSPLFTANTDPANAVVGQVTELPDCIGDPNAGARTLNLWFNPKAFAIPPANAGRYGTCGMNSLEGDPIRVAHASLAKRIPLTDWLTATLIIQASDITNTPHFTFPQNNLSNPGAGMFTAASMVDATYPERDGYRQIDVKVRLVW
jgi:hypothetical protein